MPVQTTQSSYGYNAQGRDVYEHPMFRYLTNLIPRRLKALFRLCEQVFIGPHANSGIRKIAEYPITDPELTTDNVQDKQVMKDLLRNVFMIKREQIKSMYNLFVYGNDFSSFHTAFLRDVKCEHCGSTYNISKLRTFKYHYQTVRITYQCQECGETTTSGFQDKQHNDITRCSIVHWDAKRITIDHNAITKDSKFYYDPSPEMKSRVQNGDKHLVATLPIGFLNSIAKNSRFKFDDDQIYHMKVDAPTGLENESGWGIPVVLSAIETYLYISLMRKGNESMALERIESFRMVYPATNSPTGDPSYALSMRKHVNELSESYEHWRRGDRNAVFFSPVPVGTAQIGGDARPLLTHQEILSAEDNILAIIGIPREFVYGGMSYGPGSAAVLRQIENQLVAHISQSSGLLQWIVNKITDFKGMQPMKAKMGKFTIQDDAFNKQAALQLYQTGELSAETMMRVYSFDRGEEQDRIQEETIERARRQAVADKKMQEIQNDLVAQAQMKAESGGPMYDTNKVMASADQMVQQMLQDPSLAKSLLSNLQNEDPVMYAVVRTRWEQASDQQGRQQ